MPRETETEEKANQEGWDIYSALETPRTDFEASPPEGTTYDQASVPISVTVSNPLFGVIRNVETEYGLSSKSQAAQRLLRVGLQEIEAPEYGDLDGDEIARLKEYRAVVFKFVPDVGDSKFGFGALREKVNLPVDYGWDKRNHSESFSVFWNQKDKITRYNDNLRVPTSDVFQWGIVNAAVVMGEEGLVDEPGADRIQQEITNSVRDRIQFIRSAALQSISNAYSGENHERVAGYCQRNVPDLWDEFKENTYSNHQSLSDNEFLYGIDY